MKKVVLGMSGGVDSAVAAFLLMREGYEVIGVTFKLLDGGEQAEEDAANIAERLGIRHMVVDRRAEFERDVIADFVSEYRSGGTPNPCVMCNRHIKFPELLKLADKENAEYAATGHYARLIRIENQFRIAKAKDRAKDQSYVLYPLANEQLSRVLLPLGEYTKQEVRALAEKNGFANAHKGDSQDICFVPNGDYASFIENYTGEKCPAGSFIDLAGNVLGLHNGVIRYTVGQRKGLGIALGKRSFVCAKDVVANTVTLGENEDLFSDRLTAHAVNWQIHAIPEGDVRLAVKIRYNQAEQPATVSILEERTIEIRFDKPQRAIASGQSAVLYDGDVLVGGGIID